MPWYECSKCGKDFWHNSGADICPVCVKKDQEPEKGMNNDNEN